MAPLSNPAALANPTRPALPRWWRSHRLLLPAVAFLATLLAFGWTLDGYFVGDDFACVGRYFGYSFAQWPRLFAQGWADGLWSVNLRELRPLNALAFMLDGKIWGLNPAGFRVTNLLLHAACAATVGAIAWCVSRRSLGAALAATLFFALHPVHAPTVAWITGRVDILSTLFGLAAFFAFLEYRDSASPRWFALLALSFAAALYTKEAGLTLPLLFAAADLVWLRLSARRPTRHIGAPYVVCAIVLAAYFLCRRIAFGVGGPAGVGAGWPDALNAATYATIVQREFLYACHLLQPVRNWLVEWRDARFAFSLRHAAQAGALALGGIAAGLLLWRWCKLTPDRDDRRTVLFFGPVWFFVVTVPLVVTYFSARHVYPAAAGFAIALALLLRGALRSRRTFATATALLTGCLGLQLVLALRPWHDAALLSRRIAHEIELVQPDLAAGDVLVVDVPDLVQGAFCWSWAMPHALRPPFMGEHLDDRITVIESPGTYAFTANWRRQPAMAALLHARRTCWVVRATSAGAVERFPVPAASVRVAAERLERESRQPEFAWAEFMSALGPP